MNQFLRISYILSCILTLSVVAANAQAPVANFSASPTSSCAPALVQFTDLSTNTPTGWNWNLGNGTFSSTQHPSTTYNTPGTYTITLTASNASGSDTKVLTSYITILPAPTISFGAIDTTPSCISKTVQFTNASSFGSTGSGTYYWDFGDGTNSSSAAPSHTYSSPGSYTVSLVVTNSAGCTKVLTKNQYITVLAKPTANFTATNVVACSAPLATSFTNTSVGGATYAWDFGDGGTSTASSPSHTYANTGSYTVRLITTSAGGCRDTITKSAFVNVGSIIASFTQSHISACLGTSIAFINTSSPSGGSTTWDFGDGTGTYDANPNHNYATPGTYTVKLIYSYGTCKDSTTRTVTVLPKPTASFTGSPLTSCSAPLTTTFTNNSINASSYLWYFGDGTTSTSSNPSNIYNNTGSYNVTLVATHANGCKDSIVKQSYVVIQPISATINGGSYIGCAPATGTYFASVISLVPITSYSWNFGDGGTGTGSSVSHVYTIPGTYTISLTVTAGTCTTTSTGVVIVGTKPTTNFTASPLITCVNSPVSFTDSSVNATSYTWLFGDGGSSTLRNPTRVYSTPGTYTVTLITSNNGCKDTLTRTNYITVLPPSADFTFTYSCSNRKQFTFTNTSVGATSYSWNFGDGSGTSTVASPTYTYAAFGTYNVTLTVTNSATGCTNTIVKTVKAFSLSPAFTESDTVICKGSSLTLSASTAGYSTYTWNFGDGYIASGFSASHNYNTAGTYNTKLLVIDGIGCRDSLTKLARIYVKSPTADFAYTPAGGCGALNVTFTDQSIPSAGSTITNRKWIFGDGTSLNTTATTISHSYTYAGNYSVKLIVTESGGCIDSINKTNIILVNRPTSQFSSPDVLSCLGKPTSFVNTSIGGTSLSYSWAFGDGSTSNATSPSYVYPDTGIYTVRLIATDINGCKDTLVRTSYINVSTVRSSFAMSDSTAYCPPFTVNFTNASVNAVAYQWIFGNGSTSSLFSPSATYTQAGTYQVKLVATSANGCLDTSIHTIVVGPSPTGTLTYTPLNSCGLMSVTFSTTSQNTTSITYDFDNGTTQTTTSSTVTYTYSQPGIFIPKVIFNNVGGCSTYLAGSDTIRSSKAYAGFVAAPNTVCIGASIQFNDTSHTVASTSSTYNWAFGDGGTSTMASPTHTYTTAGTYIVRQIVSTSLGCKDTAFRTVVINPLPILSISNQAICNGSSVQLPVTGAGSYSWTPATGLSCANCATPWASPSATTTYSVTGTSAQGCVATTNVTVTVNPVPTVGASSPVSICSGASTTLTATGAASYVWSPATGLSCTTCANPTASSAVTTTYKVVGTNVYGCSDSAMVNVTVNQTPSVVTGGNQFICPGGSASLNASGATSYVWSPSTGLSCTTCAAPTASPSATTVYKVVGTGAGGCMDSTTVTVAINGIPSITVGGTTSMCAGGSTALTASGANTYLWSPATGLSCTSCANPTASPTVTTTYTVSGTSGIGCSGSTTVTVTVNPLPIVNAGPDVTLCSGASATLTASGASTYSWSPATGLSCTSCANPTLSPTTATSCIVTGTDINGCSNKDTVVVTVNPLPLVSAGPNQAICPGGNTTLNATGAVGYVWSPATGLSCTTCASPSASPVVTTAYKVVGTSSLGCTDSSTVTVAVNATPVVVVTGIDTLCAGNSTTLTASGAANFSWSPTTGLSCTTCASPIATPVSTTTYTITGTSGVGCSATTSYTVTVNPLPNVSAGIDTAFCAGSSVTLNATGAATYSWSPASGLSCTSCASPIASGSATTTYVVTGTSVANCVNTDTITVTVKALPVVSAGTNVSICPGGSVGLNATGAVSYVWTPSTGLSCTTCASPTASPASNTLYSVTGTGANGCTFNSSVNVSVNANPAVTITGNNAICLGGSAALTATGANTYSWTPSTGLSCTSCANPTANPASTTTYTVTGTSGVGCSATTTFTLTVNPLPAVSAGADKAICAGGSATLTATGASTYSWSPATGLSCTGCVSPVAGPAATTTYIVTGTDANGCVNTDTVELTVNPIPTVSAGSNVSICPGGNTTLSASGASTYSWSPATGLSCTTCASPVASPSATTTYILTGTSAAGCVDTAHVTVSVNATPTVSIAGLNAICAGNSTVLTASGASTYSWSPASGLSCTTCSNPTADPTSTNTYTVTGTSGVGCTGTSTFTLTVNPLPVVNAGRDTAVCTGTSVTLTATGASTYSWSPSTGLSCTACPSPVATPAATSTYVATGTSSFGCISTDTVVVTINALPNISAGSNTGICPGGSVTLSPSGGVSYVWNASSSLSCTSCTSPVATPTATTTYTVTGTGANGCTGVSAVTVTVNPLPTVSVGGNTDVCSGTSTILTATGASTYSWGPATGLSCTTCPSPTVTPTATITYTVIGTSGLGCVDSASITINLRPLPVIAVNSPQTTCLNTPVNLTASGASSYSWSPSAGLSCNNCASPVATPGATTTYIVTGTDTYGCMDSAQTTVTVLELPKVDAGPDVSICKGRSTVLSASGAISYLWSPSNSLSCSNCANPTAIPAVTTAYVLTGTGANGGIL